MSSLKYLGGTPCPPPPSAAWQAQSFKDMQETAQAQIEAEKEAEGQQAAET